MCGIAGGMSKAGFRLPIAKLKKMQSLLRHRGSDDRGSYKSHNCGLIHNRLSIIDLENGSQPLSNSDGSFLVANAQIYNDKEIRESLPNFQYSSNSDNESILSLYSQFGTAFAEHLRGMYALAIYDKLEDILILARDRFGIKPLYVASNTEALWFASQLSALTGAGIIKKKENIYSRNQLLGLQYISGVDGPISGIKRVAPGETIVIKEGQIIDRIKLKNLSLKDKNLADPQKEFDKLWMDSMQRHLRSDVPYGLFLSGGVDSSAILVAMARLGVNPIITYTAGFSNYDPYDETKHAKKLAQSFGAENINLDIKKDDFWNHLPRIVASIDDPVADYAIVPTFLLAEKAAQDIKVILSGEGGDEVFAGYGRYRSALRIWPFSKSIWASHFLQRAKVMEKDSVSWRKEIYLTEKRLDGSELSKLQKMQIIDIEHWLPNDLLTKLDRCLMANGVEGRVPFLDKPLVEFGLRISDSLKLKNGLGKWLLRKWLFDNAPESDPFSKKRGFSIPVADWISTGGNDLGVLVANQPGVESFCKRENVIKLFGNLNKSNRAYAAWLLLFYALWHQCHILNLSAEGNIYDVLSQV